MKSMQADGILSACEESSGGLMAKDDYLDEQTNKQYANDISGTPLDTKLVEPARPEKTGWTRKGQIHEKVP